MRASRTGRGAPPGAGRAAAVARPARTPARGAGRGQPSAPPDDRVYDAIREAVLDHRLPPGTKLREVTLAELFGTTRTVVRKALARLAHVRLVDLRPNRGAVVASPTIEETRDLFAARGAIEGAIVETLARSRDRGDLRALRALIRAERDAYARGDPRQGLKLSVEFHRVLARAAGNGVLAEFLEQLVSRTPLVVLAHQGSATAANCSDDEHSRIVDAIAAEDGAAAVAAMRGHLDRLLAGLDLRAEGGRTADLGAMLGLRPARAATTRSAGA